MRITRERKNQRGAALVEAAVVIPFFLLMLAGVIFVGKMYQTKLQVMRLSKQSAWTYAMQGCQGDGHGTDAGEPNASKTNGGSGFGAPTAILSILGSSNPLEDALDDAEVNGQKDVTADNFVGGYTKTMRSHIRVRCNAVPSDSVFGNAFSFITGG
ncbi:MAG: TadE/TadG family type IV pilus assembly protein [Polyangiales bacterium]